MKPKGFTLIELLVVIAILAVLAVAVVLVLNPAELIKQARDTTRISDLATLNSAISLYIADVTSPDVGACATNTRCTAAGTSPMTNACTTVTSTVVTGTGWVDIDFVDTISSGSPLGRLPTDPVNDTTYFYAYFCNDTAETYEIDANMESAKYMNGGGSDVEDNDEDGGNNANWYEVGNDPGLDL